MALKERIEVEQNIGFTRRQAEALEVASAVFGMKRGQIIRQGAAEWLISRGLLEDPLTHLNTVLNDAKNGGKAKP
jgi:hypothetical protein